MEKPVFAVNLLWLRPGLVGGTEVFIRNLLDGFCGIRADIRLVLIVTKDNRASFAHYEKKDARIRLLCVRCNSAVITKRILWQNLFLNGFLRRNGLRYCFSPVYDRPYFNGGIHYLNVIHDIQAYHYPAYHPKHEVWYSKATWHACKRSDGVVAISESVRKDLEEILHIKPEKLRVIYNPVIVKESDTVPFSGIAEKYGIREKEYYYTVCQMIPHKNVSTLLRVIRYIRDHRTGLQEKLLVSGISGNASDQIVREIRELGIEDRIVLTGYVEDGVRNTLYRHAKAFLFPSVFEGFGIPPVEAMMCGATVICSNRTSIPEVTQQLANYVEDPYDVEAWVECMRNAVNRSAELDRTRYDAKGIAKRYVRFLTEHQPGMRTGRN